MLLPIDEFLTRYRAAYTDPNHHLFDVVPAISVGMNSSPRNPDPRVLGRSA